MGEADSGKGKASSRSDGEGRGIVYKANWRTAAGWVCVASLAWWFVLRDIFGWILILMGFVTSGPAPISLDFIITILGALLGLGTIKATERIKGVSNDK